MERTYWQYWVQKLQQHGMQGLALSLLEGAGPVRYIFSQCMFAITPFLDSISHVSWNTFAAMLENPADSHDFAHFLREG